VRPVKLLAGIVALALTAPAGAASAREAEPTGHDVVYLATPKNTYPYYEPADRGYAVVEGNRGDFLIVREQHGEQLGTVDWQASSQAGDTADEDSDYYPVSDSVTLEGFEVAGSEKGLFIGTIDENPTEVDEPVESFTVMLSNPRGAPGMILRSPVEAPFAIIDDDGSARIGLSSDEYSDFENRGTVRLLAVRSGDASNPASVNYATTSGTATRGASCTSGVDFVSESGSLVFPQGGSVDNRTEGLAITMCNDAQDEPQESFTVTLSGPSGADLDDPSVATVFLDDDDSPSSDTRDPVTAFHIPRHNRTYGLNSSVRNYAHISPSDDGSGIARVDFGLRKKMRNGDCAWYNGTRFRARGCSNKLFIDPGLDEDCPKPDQCFIVYRYSRAVRPLKQTTRKTGIRSYTAFARSRDNAGNLETDFDLGRNQNTFYIKQL
jgi:hypothetical protein